MHAVPPGLYQNESPIEVQLAQAVCKGLAWEPGRQIVHTPEEEYSPGGQSSQLMESADGPFPAGQASHESLLRVGTRGLGQI